MTFARRGGRHVDHEVMQEKHATDTLSGKLAFHHGVRRPIVSRMPMIAEEKGRHLQSKHSTMVKGRGTFGHFLYQNVAQRRRCRQKLFVRTRLPLGGYTHSYRVTRKTVDVEDPEDEQLGCNDRSTSHGAPLRRQPGQTGREIRHR